MNKRHVNAIYKRRAQTGAVCLGSSLIAVLTSMLESKNNEQKLVENVEKFK